MKKVDFFRWRVQNQQGKWYTTQHTASEEEIRGSHPEAVCLAETRVSRDVPETDDERLHLMYSLSARIPEPRPPS